jgi:hypothetical protein
MEENIMDHSQFYMTADAYKIDALESRIKALEKEIRALKGQPEPEQPAYEQTSIHEIIRAGVEKIFEDYKEEK